MTGPQKFTIPGRLPGLNEYTRACRASWHSGNGMKRDHTNRIAWIVRQANLESYDSPVEVSFAWVEPNDRRDIDNITFGAKFILDALKESQVIKDDNLKCVRRIFHAVAVDKSNPHIEVAILPYERNRTVEFLPVRGLED